MLLICRLDARLESHLPSGQGEARLKRERDERVLAKASRALARKRRKQAKALGTKTQVTTEHARAAATLQGAVKRMLAMRHYIVLCSEVRASAVLQATILRALKMREHAVRMARNGAGAIVLQSVVRRMLAVAWYSGMRVASTAATRLQSATRRMVALRLYIEVRARVEAARAARRRRLKLEEDAIAARLQPVMGAYIFTATRSQCTGPKGWKTTSRNRERSRTEGHAEPRPQRSKLDRSTLKRGAHCASPLLHLRSQHDLTLTTIAMSCRVQIAQVAIDDPCHSIVIASMDDFQTDRQGDSKRLQRACQLAM